MDQGGSAEGLHHSLHSPNVENQVSAPPTADNQSPRRPPFSVLSYPNGTISVNFGWPQEHRPQPEQAVDNSTIPVILPGSPTHGLDTNPRAPEILPAENQMSLFGSRSPRTDDREPNAHPFVHTQPGVISERAPSESVPQHTAPQHVIVVPPTQADTPETIIIPSRRRPRSRSSRSSSSRSRSRSPTERPIIVESGGAGGTEYVGMAYQVPVASYHHHHRGHHDMDLRDQAWYLSVYSRSLEVSASHIRYFRELRTQSEQYGFVELIHDLLSHSLLPLNHQYDADSADRVIKQAAQFFSAFTPNALWYVNTKELPPSVGRTISGLTTNSRKPDLGSRFIRFRFPYVTFEWSLQTPVCELIPGNEDANGIVTANVLWKAWARSGTASGLVAYGTIQDDVYIQEASRRPPVIAKRIFQVIRVFQPELMTPVPYLRIHPPVTKENDFVIFSTSWTVIQFLRSSRTNLAFLVSLSALFASLTPIVNTFNANAGFLFAGIGILSALTSIAALLLGWSLSWIEAHAARKRQLVESDINAARTYYT